MDQLSDAAVELARLSALAELEILGTPAEVEYDELVQLASELCGTPIALVTLVDEHRQWFKASFGLVLKETPREVSFCSHAIAQEEPFIVEDAAEDPRFRDSPLVTGEPKMRFYAGVPLKSGDGHAVGTLCVIDRSPRTLTPFQLRALSTLARQVEAHFALRLQLTLLQDRERSVRAQHEALAKLERRKQELTSLIVHDLKSPLASLIPNAEYLLACELPEAAMEAVRPMLSAARSMNRLIANLLDIGASEDGALKAQKSRVNVGALIRDLADMVSTRAREAGKRFEVGAVPADVTLDADANLLRRILENLVDNALKYGDDCVRVEVRQLAGALEFRVSDEGPGIPPEARDRVFEKYARLDDAGQQRRGQGLGLHFCWLATEAQGGSICVESNHPRGSVFCVRLPHR